MAKAINLKVIPTAFPIVDPATNATTYEPLDYRAQLALIIDGPVGGLTSADIFALHDLRQSLGSVDADADFWIVEPTEYATLTAQMDRVQFGGYNAALHEFLDDVLHAPNYDLNASKTTAHTDDDAA